MTDSSRQPGDEESDLALPKLDREILGQVLKSNSSSLARAVRRVVDQAENRTGNYAAFGNAP